MLIEGFGASATGGAGGTTYTVTSTVWDAAIEGTLPWALAQDGPRIVQFSVAGVITPPERFTVPNDTTLDGSTAPAPGVCIKGCANVGSPDPATWPSNIIVTHMRFRPGGVSEGDPITLMGTHIALDHCSISWGNDENIGCKNLYSDGDPERFITVQWCLLAYAEKGCLASPSAHKTTFHHNLWAHHYHRNPVVAGDDFAHVVDIRNNVVFDFGEFGIGVKGDAHINCVGNYVILRPERFEKAPVVGIQDGRDDAGNVEAADPARLQVYLSDLSGPGTRGDYGDAYASEWEEVRRDDLSVASLDFRADTPFDAPVITTETSAEQAYIDVLAGAGATLPERDTYDAQMVADVEARANMGSYLQDPAPIRALAVEEWDTLSYEEGDGGGSGGTVTLYFVAIRFDAGGGGEEETAEDLTTYTEVDPADYLTVTPERAHVASWMARNVDVRLVKDFGTDHFTGDFSHTLETQSNRVDTGSYCGVWGLANTEDDMWALWDSTDALWVYWRGGTEIGLRVASASASSFVSGLSVDTTYYLTVSRTGAEVTLSVYSDEARTTLVGSTSISEASAVAYRYAYAINSRNDGRTGDYFTGWMQNLIL